MMVAHCHWKLGTYVVNLAGNRCVQRFYFDGSHHSDEVRAIQGTLGQENLFQGLEAWQVLAMDDHMWTPHVMTIV